MEQEAITSYPSSSGPQHFIFSKAWDLRVAPKITHFIWRVLHNILPTGSNLKRRKIQIEPHCKFCQFPFEDIIHVFKDCKYIQEIYGMLKIDITCIQVTNFRDLMEQMWKSKPPDLIRLWVVCLWDTWTQRNKLLREETHRKPLDVFMFAQRYVAEDDLAPNLIANLQPPAPALNGLDNHSPQRNEV